MSVEAIYDFETAIEAAVAKCLRDVQELTTATPADAATFQNTRPRVEVTFTTGAAKQSFHMVSGIKRNATWGGQLHLDIITAADSTGKASHRTYRAFVREALANLLTDINGNDPDGNAYLPCHHIQNIVEAGTIPQYQPQTGIEQSGLIFNVEFGVDAGAWVELTT